MSRPEPARITPLVSCAYRHVRERRIAEARIPVDERTLERRGEGRGVRRAFARGIGVTAAIDVHRLRHRRFPPDDEGGIASSVYFPNVVAYGSCATPGVYAARSAAVIVPSCARIVAAIARAASPR